MKAKISYLLILCTIIVFVFTGCNNNTNTDGKETGKETEVAKKEDSNDQDKSDSIYTEPGTYPIVKEKIELSVVTINTSQVIDWETNGFTKLMEDKTNIHINWELIPSETKAKLEKLNLTLASGNYPDVFFGLGVKDNMEALYGVEQQVFIPLNDLIDNYAPNFKNNVLDKYETARSKVTALDGNIYALPSVNECYQCAFSQKFWINRYWMDNLGLEMPTTTDEFYEVLKAFKENDPNQNGKKDEIPMSASDTWQGDAIPYIMNAFILDPGMYDKMKSIVENGEVKSIVNTEEYREGLKYIKKLYDEGLIAKGSFTQKSDQLKQIVTNPDVELVGGYPAGFSGMILEAGVNPERYTHYEAVPPLEGPKGVKQATKFDNAIALGEFLITEKCEYPQAAIRWADYLYTTEGSFDRRGMVEGVDYEKAKPGELGLNGKQGLIKRLVPYSNEPQNKGYAYVGIEYEPRELRFAEVIDPEIDPYTAQGLGLLLFDVTKNKYEPYTPDDVKPLPITRLTGEESDELQVIQTELEKYIEESRLKFLLSEWDLETDWEAYKEGLQSIGMDKFYEIYQKAYDRQYGK